MRLTNHFELPEVIVRAVENDQYDPGSSDFTATSLILPPQIAHLRRENWKEIEEDVSDRIWALLGSAVHAIIERAGASVPTEISEERLYAMVDGYTIGGQVDNRAMHLSSRTLTDWKVTSVWSAIDGAKREWVEQLNIYNFLASRNGYEIDKLQVGAIYRDWSRGRAKGGGDYPQKAVELVPVDRWPLEVVEQFIVRKLREHTADTPRPCTDDERWAKPEEWAVEKKGNKRALRVVGSYDEAMEWARQKGHVAEVKGEAFLSEGITIEQRPRVYVRCEGYCNVAQWCPQLREEE